MDRRRVHKDTRMTSCGFGGGAHTGYLPKYDTTPLDATINKCFYFHAVLKWKSSSSVCVEEAK